MTTQGGAHKQRGASTMKNGAGMLVVVALSLAAFFGQLGLALSFGVLILGFAAVGIGHIVRTIAARERPSDN